MFIFTPTGRKRRVRKGRLVDINKNCLTDVWGKKKDV